MTETIQNSSLLSGEYEKKPLSTGLNVLTILTIVWCVISFGLIAMNFIGAKSSYEKKEESIARMQDPATPKFVRTMMGDPANLEKMIVKSYENRVPMLLLGVVSLALCLIGAIQMRKLKKQGYLLYVVGELLPFLSMAVFIGLFAMSGIIFIISLAFSLLFILLYTLQKKYLVN